MRVIDGQFKQKVVAIKLVLTLKDKMFNEYTNKSGVANFNIDDSYIGKNATIIIDDEFKRFNRSVFQFVPDKKMNPVIMLQPYMAIRLNFTNNLNSSIRKMNVKLWKNNESSQLGNVTTSKLGSAVWFIP